MREVKSRTTWYVCPETGQEQEQEQEQEQHEQDAETGQCLHPSPRKRAAWHGIKSR